MIKILNFRIPGAIDTTNQSPAKPPTAAVSGDSEVVFRQKMDGNTTTKKNGTSSTRWGWTNERHLRFLNSIEASFVRAMFEKNGHHSDLPLDRHIPDSSESTKDLLKERRRRYSTSDAEEPRIKNDKKNSRLFSNDQVVPQLEREKKG